MFRQKITELDRIIEIMSKCDVCWPAIDDVGYPYIVPHPAVIELMVKSITAKQRKIR